MLQDLLKKERDTIGKMIKAIMERFFGKTDEFNFQEFSTALKENENLYQLYSATSIDGFRRIILNLNIDEYLRLSLIQFFYQLHLTEENVDKKQLAKLKCQDLIDNAQTVNMEIFQISQKLNS